MSDYDFTDQLVPYSFFQSVIDLLPIAVDIINEEKTSVLSNEQFGKMFSWNDVYPFHQEIEQVFSSRKAVNMYDYKVQALSGHHSSIHLIIEPLLNHSEVIGAIVIAKDITQIIAYQDENAQMGKIIAQLKDELAKALDTINHDGFSDTRKRTTTNDQKNEIKELQSNVDYTSRDDTTWMALRDLRYNLKNHIPTYLYGELGVDKHQIITQMIKIFLKQDIYWIEVTKPNQIKDVVQHLHKSTTYTGITITDEKLLRNFIAAVKEKCKISTIDKKGYCKWIIVGNAPVIPLQGFHGIKIPPLRERKGDVLLLAEKILPEGISLHEEVKKKFIQYDWPQNIRQLRSVLRYALTMCSPRQKTVTLEQVPEIFPTKKESAHTDMYLGVDGVLKAIDQSNESMPEIFDQIEKKYIEQVLQQQLYNITHTANKLGIKRQALQYKLKKYNLLPEEQNSEIQ